MVFRDGGRTALLVGGGAAALAAGLAIAWALSSGRPDETPPPASKAGLVIDPTAAPDAVVAPTKSLRCFVAGRFVGEFTLLECARRNGVATDALDVGVDPTGALAASHEGGSLVTPLPPTETAKPPLPPRAVTPVVQFGACWRYDGGWRKLPSDMTLGACTQALFANRCEKAGGASYGRWAQQTLRLVPGRVEISGDNRTFRTLADQGPGCSLPAAG